MSISSFSGLFFFFHLLFSFFINIHRNEAKKKKADENFLPLIFCSEYTNKRESERDEISRRNEFSNRFILLNIIIRRWRPSVLKQQRRRWWCINLTMICEWKWLSSDLLGIFLRLKRCFLKDEFIDVFSKLRWGSLS